ncbi:MAG TPA: hypothetical protein VKB80_09825 [Kofleriaceae bacterium]|nr:hypothetical protein [Kofleriaceae bacterium]
MTEAGHAALCALRALCDATEDPPAADADPQEVMTRAAEVVAARELPMRDLAAALAREPGALRGHPEACALYDRIRALAASWDAAMACARHGIGERIRSVARLRGARRSG